MTDIYSSMLSNMRGPEGSEINERLKKLQDLERVRKEREASRHKIDMSTGTSVGSRRARNRMGPDTAGVQIQYTSRRARPEMGSNDDISTSGYSGARPKLSSYSDNDGSSSRSMLGPRSRLGSSDSEYSQFSYQPDFSGNANNYGQTFSVPSFSTTSYTRSLSKPEETGGGNIFSGIVDSLIHDSRKKDTTYSSGSNSSSRLGSVYDNSGNGYKTERRQRRYNRYNDNKENNEPDYRQADYDTQQGQVENDEQDYVDGEAVYPAEEHYNANDDMEEEPYHFIERLRQGDQSDDSDSHYKRNAPYSYAVSPIPSVPPMKRARNSIGDDESVESEEDIVALAKNIHATFGIRSPKTPDSYTRTESFNFSDESKGNNDQNGDMVFSANTSTTSPSKRPSVKRKSTNKQKERRSSAGKKKSQDSEEAQDHDEDFVVYEIHEVEYDSEEDDEREPLPIDTRSSFYQKTTTDGLDFNQSPRKLDQMYEFFTGNDVTEEPELTRVLNGSMVEAEWENTRDDNSNTIAEVKDAFENLVDFNDVNGSDRPNVKKEAEIVNKHVKKIKDGNKSSDSDNDSFKTASESESGSPQNQSPSPRKNNKRTSKGTPKANIKNSADKRKSPLTIDDKLKKLEIMTQEKTRKKSIGENDDRKPLPSYMTPTSASQKKTAKVKESSMTDIVKDVRDLKRFVQENTSEPNSPIKTATPTRELKSPLNVKKIVHNAGTQTNISDKNINIIYVCKHCGKSGNEPVENSKEVRKRPGSSSNNETKDQTKENQLSEKMKSSNQISNTEKFDERKCSKESSPSSTGSNSSKTKWESKSEKDVPVSRQYNEKRSTPEMKRSLSKESLTSESSVFEERKQNKVKTTPVSRGYMKGTTSSILKNSNESKGERSRKSSAPDIHKAKGEDVPKFTGKGLVAQRAKGFETFSKNNSQKVKEGHSMQRGKSAERHRSHKESRSSSPEEQVSPRLSKAKSVDEMHWIPDKTIKAIGSINIDIDNTEISDDSSENKLDVINRQENSKTEANIEENKTRTQILKKSAPVDEMHLIPNKTVKDIDIDNTEINDKNCENKLDVINKQENSKTEANIEENKSRTQVLKKSAPPPISPKPTKKKMQAMPTKQQVTQLTTKSLVENPKGTVEVKEPLSPKPAVLTAAIQEIKAMSKNPKGLIIKPETETTQDTVDSQGQFLTLGENPFIKNDVRRRNSLKGHDEESIWEKECRSRDSSLKRSDSFDAEKPQRNSSLRRSNTSAGERSSLTQLSWSDSGSSGSLASPKSQKIGSNLKKSGSGSSFHGSFSDLNTEGSGSPVKVRSGSVSSSASQNSMLNLLSTPSSKRDVVTGAVETDVDAAYTEYVKSQAEVDQDAHDEASVEKAHLEFAKKACDLLEFETTKRDSSSDSQSNDTKKGGNTKTGNCDITLDKSEVIKTEVKAVDMSDKQGKKGKKSFLKGRLFKR